MRANSVEWAASSGSEAGCSLEAGRSIGSSSLGLDFSSGDEALCVGTGGVMGSFSTTSSMVRSNRLPFSSRGARHLWSSWTALHSTPGGILDCVVHLWRAWASTTISSCFTIWMSQMPWNSVGGRKSFYLNTPRQGWAAHSCSFLVWQMAFWRPQLANRLILWLGCYWGAQHLGGKWTRIPSTGWVPFCSSQHRARFSCWWCLGQAQLLAGLSFFLGRVVAGFWSRGCRSRATQSINLCSGFPQAQRFLDIYGGIQQPLEPLVA